MGNKWAIEEYPLVTKVDGDLLTFGDGTKKAFDVIIYCTGYKHNFPFLSDDLKPVFKRGNALWLNELKNGVGSFKNDRIYFMAM